MRPVHPLIPGAAFGLRALRGPLTAVLDLLLPPQCLRCGATVDGPGQLCGDCWARLRFVAPPYCACCGAPFALDFGTGTLCASCIRQPPAFRRARAVLLYDAAARPLILGFKHGDRTERAVPFGRWLARAGADLLEGDPVIAPVPLHRWRLLFRRYNQAGLLAQAVGRVGGRAVLPDLLARVRATPAQGHLSRAARRRNVAGAFAVRPRYAEMVRGRTVLLVDDVMTTGATVGACARVLLRAGAAAVDVLTLARVPLDDQLAG